MIDLNCEIINVGTELLLGDILNTDARFLSVEISKLGLNLLYESVVGDNPDRLRKQLEISSERSEILIISGGLGPTPDDLTKEVVCDFFGKELFLHEPSLTAMKEYFAAKGAVMPESNIKQAMLPEGCTVFENRHGTAPGCGFEADGVHVLLLPGPPYELEPMFNTCGKSFLKPLTDGVLVSHYIKTFGIGESALAELVSDYLGMSNPTVATYAKIGESFLRVTAKAEKEQDAINLCNKITGEICDVLGSLVYGIDSPSIEFSVVNELKKKNLRIAAAESCTGGLIAKRITDVPGASSVFECGFVTYSNEIKRKILGVSEESLSKFGAVSSTVAEEMALGALKRSGADIAVSVTGIAGPGSDASGIDAGISYIGIAYEGKAVSYKLDTGKNDREYNRFVNASNAFNYIRLLVNEI